MIVAERPQPFGRRVLLAIISILLRMAYLGNSIESHHATITARVVPQLQHLHVRHHQIALPGRITL